MACFFLSLLSIGIIFHVCNSENICVSCERNKVNTPYYCSVKPSLAQCVRAPCPKFCDTIDPSDPTSWKKLPPYPSSPEGKPPHPVRLPSVGKDKFKVATRKVITAEIFGKGISLSGKITDIEHPEDFYPYDDFYCDFESPFLKRIRPGSKYVEYRPRNVSYQVRDIHEIAKKFGLVLAEMRTVGEWLSVERSSVLDTVSSYKNTEQESRIYYGIGFLDEVTRMGRDHGDFVNPVDNTSSPFVVMTPRIFGRRDEQCGVLSHIFGSDQKNYLTARLWSCGSNFGGKMVSYGLFMFPPGSQCYIKSEEECEKLKIPEKKLYDLIEIGQTLKRFIYIFTDQRSWSDSNVLCESKGLKLLDLDPIWGDAATVGEIIERFLRAAQLSSATMFWTSGKFDIAWSDKRFKWVTTGNYLEVKYPAEPPPFAFSWWDDQKNMDGLPPQIPRRPNIPKPCVSLALNPEEGGTRPKLNFKAWYCNFPMFPLCYRQSDHPKPSNGPAPPPTYGSRIPVAPGSCEKPPERPIPPKEIIDPFNPKTCSSKSPLLKRLSPNSKYVDYQPLIKTYSVAQIKEQCKLYGLVPGQVHFPEDWESIRRSGIGGIVTSDSDATGSGTDYFYVIGMDDSKEEGKIRNNYDNSELSFSMFNPDGNTYMYDRCTILDSATAPDKTRGLMMLHAYCDEGLKTERKVAYGLCMFPPDWDCFKMSKEEKEDERDPDKYTTIIDLGVTATRSIFFNPVQRNWANAKEFCEAAKLSLIDFDPIWDDTKQVITIFMDKIVRDGGQFQLTPIWTSGRLTGRYNSPQGKWTSTGTPLDFPSGANFKWLRYNDGELDRIREGTHSSPCVEGSFNGVKYIARLRPDYCSIPKYFLCYRKSKRRKDPKPKNHIGITVVERI